MVALLSLGFLLLLVFGFLAGVTLGYVYKRWEIVYWGLMAGLIVYMVGNLAYIVIFQPSQLGTDHITVVYAVKFVLMYAVYMAGHRSGERLYQKN